MNDMLVKGYARKVPLNTTAPEERQSMVLAAPRSISPKKARQSPCLSSIAAPDSKEQL